MYFFELLKKDKARGFIYILKTIYFREMATNIKKIYGNME
jgi:hypothetical protein